ncbi:MAG: hypothetical protein ACOYZ6_11370 [Chloroflexota bacterium]
MKKRYIPFLLAIVLSACSTITSSPTRTPIPVPSPTPTSIFRTPTPFPTITSFEALKIFPSDKFLFAVVGSGDACSEECHCPVSEPIVDPYRFVNGKLYLWYGFLQFEGVWTDARKTNDAVGFYGYRTMNDAHFDFITSFPYKSLDSVFVINDVDHLGNISVKTIYGNVLLKPGEFVDIEWIETNDIPSCEISHLVGIDNYGFIKDDQVIILRDGEWYP